MNIAVAILAGVFAWTFTEYAMHRFVLHGYRSVEHTAGHHATPHDYGIGPSWLSIVGVFVGFWILSVVVGLVPFAAGYTVAFGFYLVAHYLCHHWLRLEWCWLRPLRFSHNIHHFHDDTVNFGVSTPLWDIVFRTYKRHP